MEKLLGENLRYEDDSKEELKSLLMKVNMESAKDSSKLSIQKMKIMAFSPITPWQIDGETMETARDFIWGDPKITADGDYSYEIKKRLLLGRKVMINLEHIKKQRHYFADKGPYSRRYGFSNSHVWV